MDRGSRIRKILDEGKTMNDILALTELKAVCPLCGAPIDKPHGMSPGDLLEPRAVRCLVCPWVGTALFMVQPEIRG